VTAAAYVALGLAATLFCFRLLRGPSLADRVIGIDGMIVCGMSLLIVRAMDTGRPLHRRARRVIGEVITLLGAVLILLSAVGVVRFSDVLARMQSLTKASTIGVVLVAGGSAFVLDHPNDVTSAIAAAILQLMTLPISASLIARATYLARGIEHRLDSVDELAAADRED
jgi:multicomponent Na+:H+ antiporter subunit G